MNRPSDHRRTIVRTLVAQADRLGDKSLISFARLNRRVSYAELVLRAKAGGARLSRDFKIEPGGVGATFLRNSPEVIFAGFCSMFAGLVDAPINPDFAKSFLLFGLKTSGASVVYTDVEGLGRLLDPEVSSYLAQLKVIVLCGGEEPGEIIAKLPAVAMPPLIHLEELTSPGIANDVWERIDGTSPAVIRFTSGTTGPAKAILQSNLHVLNRTNVHNGLLDFAENDVLYSPFPLHHNLAGVNGLIGTLQAGGTMVSTPRFSASRFWPEARSYGATLVHLLRSVSGMVLAQPPSPEDINNDVRWIWAGPPHEEFERRFGVKFIQIFAMGEVGVIASKRDGLPGSKGNGVPPAEMDVQIFNDLDEPLPQGEVGEIVVRPRLPHRVMLGYHNDVGATMRAFRNLFYHTGDSGHFGEDGELCFDGRMGDTIRRRGVNISSEQIESELRRYEKVVDCAVIGVPSPTGEEDVHACIIWSDKPVDETEYEKLLAYLKERLPRGYVPRFVETVSELPRTGTGKVRKAELKVRKSFERTWDSQERSWVHGATRTTYSEYAT